MPRRLSEVLGTQTASQALTPSQGPRRLSEALSTPSRGVGGTISDVGRGFLGSLKDTLTGLRDLPGATLENMRTAPGAIADALPQAFSDLGDPEALKARFSQMRQGLSGIGQGLAESAIGSEELPVGERVGRGLGFAAEMLVGPKVGKLALRGARRGLGVASKVDDLPKLTTSTAFAKGPVQPAGSFGNVADDLPRLRTSSTFTPDDLIPEGSFSGAVDDVPRLSTGTAFQSSGVAPSSTSFEIGRRVTPGQVVPGTPKPTVESVIREALEELQSTGPNVTRTTLGRNLAQPEVTISARAAKAARQPNLGKIALREAPIGKAPKVAATPLEEASKVFKGETLREIDVPTVKDLRRSLGSVEAAKKLGISPDDVKNLAPGPSRHPLVKEMGQLDAQFNRAVAGLSKRAGLAPGEAAFSVNGLLEEGAKHGLRSAQTARGIVNRIKSDPGFANRTVLATMAGASGGAAVGALLGEDPEAAAGLALIMGGLGAVAAPKFLNFAAHHPLQAKKLAKDTGEILTMIRSEFLLSGQALFKNVQSAIGSPVQAAFLKRSAKPLKEALRLPTNIKNAVKGFKMKDFETGSRSRMAGPFGRSISAVDFQAQEALKRAGLSQAESDFLLLKRPMTDFLDKTFKDTLQTMEGRVIFPFQRTGTNVLGSGMEIVGKRTPVFDPKAMNQLKWLQAAFGAGAGTVVPELTDDRWKQTAIFGLLAALVGPGAIPFGIGGAAAGASNALTGTSLFETEFSADPRKAVEGVLNPSGVRLARRLSEVTGGKPKKPSKRKKPK